MPASQPPTPSSPGKAPPNQEVRWRVGTLTYTATGLVVLFSWLLWGDFAWNMKERSVIPVAQLMMKNYKASDFLVGLLIGSLPAALGLFLGPVLGVISDRHRGPRGRRIPFLLIPTPFAALSILGLAFTPAIGKSLDAILSASSPGYHNCVLIVFGFFWVIFEVATVVANSVLGGLINDVVPHSLIGRFFGLFRAVSLIAGIVFNFYLMGKAEDYYFWIFTGIGLLYGVGFTVMCLNVREGEYPPRQPKVHNPWAGFVTYIRECYTNPFYIMIFVSFALAGLAFGPVNSFSLFYAKSIGMSTGSYGKYLALTYACSLVLSYPLGSLADRFHPLRISIVCMLLYAAVTLWGGIFARDTTTFAIAFVLHGVISGCYFTGWASLGQRLFPKARFAQFASAGGILAALTGMLLPPAVGAFLDWSGHIYRYTFTIGSILSLLAMAGFLIVYKGFKALGGMQSYQPPD